MKAILSICMVGLIAITAEAKPMTGSVESWEGKFTIQRNITTIHAEGTPKLLLWLYQLDKGSKGSCIGFSRENGDMIYSPTPNQKAVQPIYTGHSVLFGEKDTVEIIVTYDVQGNGRMKFVEKYTYDGKTRYIRLVSQSQFFGKHEPVWKKIEGEPKNAPDKR